MEVPYYNELKEIRSFFEKKIFGFPNYKCQHSARFLHLTLGLAEIGGQYYRGHAHAWSYDPSLNLFIDLTLDQFNTHDRNHKPISILSVNTKIIVEEPIITNNYRKLRDSYFVEPDLEELVEIWKKQSILPSSFPLDF